MNRSDRVPLEISLQQSEQSGRPIYANVTVVQRDQGLIVVDFGFYDPRALQALLKVSQTQTGSKISNAIDANLSRRIILNGEAASQLAHQLNQLLAKDEVIKKQVDERITMDTPPRLGKKSDSDQTNHIVENPKSGFRFPWSKK